MRWARWVFPVICAATAAAPLPELVSRDGKHALFVDGAPYLILGAEANNSSGYASMLPQVWPALEQLHGNTLAIGVSWQQIEPTEGRFDFSFVDTLIAQARERDVRLVLLWFATWKNREANFTPSWVKLDNARFPRVVNKEGRKLNCLSPHFKSTLDADRKAFATLMRHLREVDGERHTVIMVQPENEAGTDKSLRDYSPTANALFAGPVPQPLLALRGRKQGTWQEVFGRDADEYFHAWHVARFVEQVASAGKAEYPLPMFVNAVLRDPFAYQDPITTTSGGPSWNVLDLWHVAAPSIGAYAPDIYLSDHRTVNAHLDRYTKPYAPLLVMEIGNEARSARHIFDVLGRGGIGFAPFCMDFTGFVLYPLGAKTSDDAMIAPFALNYAPLKSMAREWARLAFEKRVWGVSKPDDGSKQRVDLGRWVATVSYDEWQFGFKNWTWLRTDPPPHEGDPNGGVLLAQLAPDEFLVIGRNARVEFALKAPDSADGVFFDWVQDGQFVDGKWTTKRLLNGDQTDYGLNFTTAPDVLRVKLATY